MRSAAGTLMDAHSSFHVGDLGAAALRKLIRRSRFVTFTTSPLRICSVPDKAEQLRCSNGAMGTYHFKRLNLEKGYGSGSYRQRLMSFTYGLTPDESAPYLKLPPGKKLQHNGTALALVDLSPALTRTRIPTHGRRSGMTVDVGHGAIGPFFCHYLAMEGATRTAPASRVVKEDSLLTVRLTSGAGGSAHRSHPRYQATLSGTRAACAQGRPWPASDSRT